MKWVRPLWRRLRSRRWLKREVPATNECECSTLVACCTVVCPCRVAKVVSAAAAASMQTLHHVLFVLVRYVLGLLIDEEHLQSDEYLDRLVRLAADTEELEMQH